MITTDNRGSIVALLNERDPTCTAEARRAAMQSTPAPSSPVLDTPPPTWAPNCPTLVIEMQAAAPILRDGKIRFLHKGDRVCVEGDISGEESAELLSAGLASVFPSVVVRVLTTHWQGGAYPVSGKRGELVLYYGHREDAALRQATEMRHVEILNNITRSSSLHNLPPCPPMFKAEAPKGDPMLSYPQVPSVHPGMRRQ